MNKNLKKILVTGAALLMFASVGAGVNANAARHHNVGWQQVTRATNLNVKNGQPLHLRKNQRVYVIKLSKNKKSAQIKIGRNYYNVNAKLLKKANAKQVANNNNKNKKRNKQNSQIDQKINKKVNKKRARKANKRKQQAKKFTKRINKKTHTRRNRRYTNRKNGKVLKARFRRTNNSKLWMQAGFIDYSHFPIPFTNQFINAGPDIMEKYAPNSPKAVIPKSLNVNNMIWLQGKHAFQKNATEYMYNKKAHGWVKL